jgi:valine dehydrogenase (NAD+)
MFFERLDGHEQVVFGHDEATGLRCIVALHSTALGPALGGTRFHPYADDDAALTDVLRLSRAMSYKAACAGLDVGGGKAVIIGDPTTDRSEGLLRAYGRVIESLGGRYVTACDVGTYPKDMEVIGRETRWVTGKPAEHGGAGDSGILTAFGVFVSMRACAQHRWGMASLAGRHVAVQGLGKV